MNHPTQAQSGDIAFGPDLPVGAHLVTRRPGYTHHGIYIGDGKVIHYAGLSRRLSGGPVELVSIECFAAGFGLVIIRHTGTPYSGTEAAQRAASRLGEHNYRLLTNNCEHFCLWCLFGVGRSEQVEACLHNPAHAVVVFVMLAACMLVAKWRVATLDDATACRDSLVQYVACSPPPVGSHDSSSRLGRQKSDADSAKGCPPQRLSGGATFNGFGAAVPSPR